MGKPFACKLGKHSWEESDAPLKEKYAWMPPGNSKVKQCKNCGKEKKRSTRGSIPDGFEESNSEYFNAESVNSKPKKKPTIVQGIAIVVILVCFVMGGLSFAIIGIGIIAGVPESGTIEYSVFLAIMCGGVLFAYHRLSKLISDRWNVEIK